MLTRRLIIMAALCSDPLTGAQAVVLEVFKYGAMGGSGVFFTSATALLTTGDKALPKPLRRKPGARRRSRYARCARTIRDD